MKGYTLIELLVTIVIIVLFSGASISAYLTFNENRQLDIDARNFDSVLNKIRSKAVFLEYPEGCVGLSSISVSSDTNAAGKRSVLKHTINCSNNIYDGTDEEVLSSSQFSANFSFDFLPITGNISDNANKTVILIANSNPANTKTITVDAFSGTKNEIE